MPTVPASKKTRATYATLVKAARESARRSGVLSPELVAEVAGLSPATLYSYFGSKDALLAAAFDDALTDISNVILPLASVETLLEEGWESTARQLVRAVARGFSHDGRLVRLALTRLEESQEIQAVYTAHNLKVMDGLARFARLGAVAGQLHDGDPAVLGRTALVLIQSLHNPLALSPGSGPVIDELAQALYLLLAPIRNRGGDQAATH